MIGRKEVVGGRPKAGHDTGGWPAMTRRTAGHDAAGGRP